MKSFLKKIEKLEPDWNQRSLTEEDFYRLCRRQQIKVEELPLLTVDAAYSCHKEKHYIALNTRLPAMRLLFAMYHEFGHYLMHMPSKGQLEKRCSLMTKRRGRDEKEADAFASCAILPLELLKTRDGVDLADTYGMAFFMERLGVYERYKI